MFINSIPEDFNPDYTLIGSGPAAITLAIKLSEKNKKVLILEAGGKDYNESQNDFFSGEVVGHPYFDLETSRIRALGGSSQHWGGACRPMDSIDFRNWIINKEDLDPHLLEAKKILNLSNNFQKENLSINNFYGFNILESDVNFREKYYDFLKKNKNILISLNTCLLTIDGDKKVDRIEIIKNNKKDYLKVKNLVLCCGGIENSRILLWSKEKSNKNFLKNLQIGNYWSEHPAGIVGQIVGEKDKIKNFFNLDNFQNISPSENFLAKENMNNVRLDFLFYDNTKSKNFSLIIKDLICAAPNYGKKFIETFQKNLRLHCNIAIRATGGQSGHFENRITLSPNSLDKFGIPKTVLRWKVFNDYHQSVRETLLLLGNEMIKKDLGRVGIDKFIMEENDFIPKDNIFANYHHMGGTIMSNNNKTGVVDKNLKVHGVENFFISGSSVFPDSGGWANPTLTIVQLSLRLSKFLTS